jgi:dihydrofolate reductase
VISAIVAMAKNGVIGKEGGLPWYLPAELARFKQVTMGHPIIMGRKTHESIGRALPGRTNIVITRDKDYKAAEGCIVVNSLGRAIEHAKEAGGGSAAQTSKKFRRPNEIFIIGGASVYKEAMSLLERIYLTKVNADIKGDKFFKYNSSEWKQVSSEKHPADEKNQYDFEFTILERLKNL